jgi:hypothetical protein
MVEGIMRITEELLLSMGARCNAACNTFHFGDNITIRRPPTNTLCFDEWMVNGYGVTTVSELLQQIFVSGKQAGWELLRITYNRQKEDMEKLLSTKI